MSIIEQLVFRQRRDKNYIGEIASGGLIRYRHQNGWTDTEVFGEMIYSHRKTAYTSRNFNENFHSHEFYEMLVYIDGDIEYVNENTLITPLPYTIVWYRPRQMHTTRLKSASNYNRYVYYFSDDIFRAGGEYFPMTDFMGSSMGGYIKLTADAAEVLKTILGKTDETAESDKPYAKILMKSLFFELLDLINTSKTVSAEGNSLDNTMSRVKQYIDVEFATVSSVSEIAKKLFYSREYLSRQFRQAYNIPISEYISKKRINESLSLMPKMNLTDVAYEVGFRSQSAFIAAFKKHIGILPSQYKAQLKERK